MSFTGDREEVALQLEAAIEGAQRTVSEMREGQTKVEHYEGDNGA